ncbi:molybdopterin-binding protein [Jiella sp. MQZ9-1]|uniref:Molybdopterin-binding protein n=1 Tax=Jiella flava TaxID=2816857 RepID=A0A939G0W8_9HYPH|nr:molybdopterin-binding protein [Jiella flava]MBO0663014.1 molybdopterin-binding protein [Jiella flava]MCD2471433.1 molybdopterin-binding protein [Jiella flava]
MTRFTLSRRTFLTGATLASTASLTGCFDGLGDRDSHVRNVLEMANSVTYRVQRTLLGNTDLAREYSESEIRQPQRPNGTTDPTDDDYLTLASGHFAGYRLTIGGLVEKPQSFSLDEIRAMPSRTQITRHDCVEGWSCIAKWTGVQLFRLLDQAQVKPAARYAVFACFDTMEQGLDGPIKYYESIDLMDAHHPQTILAYGLNDRALPVSNGAPLRVRVERQLGYKMAKYIKSITLVNDFASYGYGNGGYWEDNGYDWFAGI